MRTQLFVIWCLIILSGCTKPAPPPCESPPMEMIMKIFDSQNNDLLSPQVLGSYKDSVVILFKNGHANFDTLRYSIEQRFDENQKTAYVLFSSDIGFYSVQGIKTFYLKRSHSITDTIYADYFSQNNVPCSPIGFNEIKFNGVHLDKISDANLGYYFLAIGKKPVK